jgi:hypothetical protein
MSLTSLEMAPSGLTYGLGRVLLTEAEIRGRIAELSAEIGPGQIGAPVRRGALHDDGRETSRARFLGERPGVEAAFDGVAGARMRQSEIETGPRRDRRARARQEDARGRRGA